MGNNCCGEQGAWSDDNIPRSEEIEMRENVQPQTSQELRSEIRDYSNQQSKLSEFYQILHEQQTQNLNQLREHLKKNPELFFLNNLVLAVQFLNNPERDKEEIRKWKAEHETEVNDALKDIRKRCHFEGALTEFVGRNYRYQTREANFSEVMQSLRYNILHGNMEVYPKEKFGDLVGKEYAAVDDPTYRFCVEDVPTLPGWVRLRCVDVPVGQRRSDVTHSTYDSLYPDSDYQSRQSGYDSEKSCDMNGDGKPTMKPGAQNQTNSTYGNNIANRPPMKTPSPTSSSSSPDEDEEKEDLYPETGKELIQDLENRLKARGNAVPLSDVFDRNRSSQPSELRPAEIYPSVPRRKSKEVRRRVRSPLRDSSSEAEYDYSSASEIRRSIPKHSKTTRGIAPECFVSVKERVVDSIDNPHGIGSQMELKTYLSSVHFYRQFVENFYEWSERLDRGLQDATSFKAAITGTLIKQTNDCQYRTNVEFLPVVPVLQWPDIAREWKSRKRDAIIDRRTNIEYRWPRQTQIETIVKQGCHLIADGGRHRGKKSLGYNLEWQFSFVAAKEILLSSLTETHLRALLWARLIFRHVVAPIGVLSPDHLDTVFFWLVESNYVHWLEVSLGEKIKLIFETLHDQLQKQKLPHYFIRKRNLLLTKPPKDIAKAQNRLHRLKEKFVHYAMQSVKQLKCSNTVYPWPDLGRLWEIATTQLSLTAINPALGSRQLTASVTSLDEIQRMQSNRNSEEEKEGFWDRETKKPKNRPVDKTRELLRSERARIDEKNRNRTSISSERSENIDLNVSIGPFNVIQTKLILEFFIQHFIEMAKSSNRIRAYSKSIVFLDQAFNLAVLLKEENFEEPAEIFLKIIEELRGATNFGIFTEPVIDIPGTPCVFRTGVENQRNRNSTLSSLGDRRSTPLPLTPVARQYNKTNGTVKPKLDYGSDVSNEVFKWPLIDSVANSTNKINVTTATIEPLKSSETEQDQFDSSPIARRATTISQPLYQSDSDPESTDF